MKSGFDGLHHFKEHLAQMEKEGASHAAVPIADFKWLVSDYESALVLLNRSCHLISGKPGPISSLPTFMCRLFLDVVDGILKAGNLKRVIDVVELPKP